MMEPNPKLMHDALFLKGKSAICLVLLLLVLSACAARPDCRGMAAMSQDQLLACVNPGSVQEHLKALQRIADENNGNRAAGTAGFEASVDYVVETLRQSGLEPELVEFEFTYQPPSSLALTAPVSADYATGLVIGSGTGTVSGPVIPIFDTLVAESRPSAADEVSGGCERSDFAGLDFSGLNDIALVQYGGCLSSKKAVNAQAAGAEALIVLVSDESRVNPIVPADNISLLPNGQPSDVTIPVLVAHVANGPLLSQEGAEALVVVNPKQEIRQHNILAEIPGEPGGKVVMAGAHLDSVPAGPGISDNGSGSAALLETAVQLSSLKPQNTIRLAWWAAEEVGLNGSTAYVEGLSAAELQEIAFYLNFDMIGSPNPAYFIFNGATSERFETQTSLAGSAEIEQFFESYYEDLDLPYGRLDTEYHSDLIPFMNAGIPVSAIYTGSGEIKSAEQSQIFGGTPGTPFDPCYHKACDTIDNINAEAFEVNCDLAAAAVFHFAMLGG